MKQASDQILQLGKWLGGAALGAVVMYMLDPERGAPRRARSGEKLRQLGRQTGDAVERVVHGMGGQGGYARDSQSRDSYAEARPGHATQGSTPDSGDRYQESSLRDLAPDRTQDRMQDRMQDKSWSSGTSARGGGIGRRGARLAGAGVLGLGGLMAPRTPIGMAMGLAGLALLVSATTRRSLRSMLSAPLHGQLVEVEKTIRIDAAPEQVFDLFANYENFPRFMSNVIEVRDLGNRRSHWVVKGPAGSHFAWNAILTEHSRPRRLAWESEAGAEVEQSGSIQFEPIHNGTRVTVRMSYRPPAGALGQAVASMLGRDPKRQMDEDLARMKSLVERGAITQAGARHSASEGKFLH